MRIDPALVTVTRLDGVETWLWSQAGGLTQFGAYIQTLQPGAMSSERHWHSAEDEFLLVPEGVATIIDNDGAHDLGPGDGVGWRFGDPNGHPVMNQSAANVTYLILGSRVAGDICTYPDSDTRQINGPCDWRVEHAKGAVLRGGALPPELRGLPQNWGEPPDPTAPVQRFLPAGSRVWVTEDHPTHPVLGGGLGQYRHAVLGDKAGLTQFGVHLEELPPGCQSSFRHWHQGEDEMVVILTGTPVLVEDTEQPLQAGDVICWPAGMPIGHCMANRSPVNMPYLVIGTRHQNDRITYPDHDLIVEKNGPARMWLHGDGRFREP